MPIRLAAPLALLALCVAAPAAADTETPANAAQPAGQAADSAADKDRKVCRNETRTGSVMPRRVCRTVAQIEEDQRNAERFREQQNQMGAAAR